MLTQPFSLPWHHHRRSSAVLSGNPCALRHQPSNSLRTCKCNTFTWLQCSMQCVCVCVAGWWWHGCISAHAECKLCDIWWYSFEWLVADVKLCKSRFFHSMRQPKYMFAAQPNAVQRDCAIWWCSKKRSHITQTFANTATTAVWKQVLRMQKEPSHRSIYIFPFNFPYILAVCFIHFCKSAGCWLCVASAWRSWRCTERNR